MERRTNAQNIVQTIPLKGAKVLDIGCGDGSMVRLMTKSGAQVLGLECSPQALDRAKSAKPVADEAYASGVAQDIPAPDNSFDVVVYFNSFHHIPVEFMDQALAETARVLRPGGLAYISEPLAEGAYFRTIQPVDDETEVRAAAYKAIQSCRVLKHRVESRYLHPMVLADFDAFRDRIIAADQSRKDRFAEIEDQLRLFFFANATPKDGAYEFEQPMRVNLLTKEI